MQFLDETVIVVSSGSGGEGHVSFRREKYVPRGGPDGGDGGRGGHVTIVATARKNTLVDFHRRRHHRAKDGIPGGRRQMYGAAGEDLVLEVPLGTVLYDDATGEQLADLEREGSSYVIPGGRGGLGNMHFRSSTNQTPRRSLPADPGIELQLRLELKLLADIGLLGMPNAGKSTFLARVSAARPKVADYPFTTLVPQLGVVALDEDRSFVLADIPGLVEGAAEGAGLGHQFLRHVERCAGYIHLVSPDPWEADPVDKLATIDEELAAYGAGLEERPQLVVLTKIDTLDADAVDEHLAMLREASGGARVFAISAASGAGVGALLEAAHALVAAAREARREEGVDDGEPERIVREAPSGPRVPVGEEDDVWEVREE